MFTSSLYVAGLIASLFASSMTRKYERKATIISGGTSFIVGASLNASAVNLPMLIFGRIMLGVGIVFANQAVPLYLSELAPPKLRGGLNMLFQLATTLGIPTCPCLAADYGESFGIVVAALLSAGFITHNIILFFSKVAVGIVLGLKFGGDQQLSKGFLALLVAAICLFVAPFGWSWGPLGWTVPNEIFPLETRSVGQAFLYLLCTFKYGIFLFFAGWIYIMTAFVFFLLETKGVPIEEMILQWRNHWFWKKIVPCIIDEEVIKHPYV